MANDRQLPEARDSLEAKTLRDIAEHGWHVVRVRAGIHDHERELVIKHPPAKAAYEALFTYTVGLWHTFAHAELVLVGGWQHAHPYLNVAGEMVRDGARFEDGSTTDGILDGFTVRFDAVSDASRDACLTWSSWAAKRTPFPALQMVFPDTSGRWPQDAGYNGFPQPSLRA